MSDPDWKLYALIAEATAFRNELFGHGGRYPIVILQMARTANEAQRNAANGLELNGWCDWVYVDVAEADPEAEIDGDYAVWVGLARQQGYFIVAFPDEDFSSGDLIRQFHPVQ